MRPWTGSREAGLVVDALVGEQEIVIKSLGSYLGDIPGLGGAAILGNGRVALIVDVPTLLGEAARQEGSRRERADERTDERTASVAAS